MEKELGIGSKAEIEEYGIARFNAKCRESVLAYLEEWDRLTERIGFWIDLEHAYRTLDPDYIESVWWALAQIHAKGLLYEGHKVVPYCPRCGTALSSHEVALGYRDVVDPSVYVRLPLSAPAAPLREGDALLIWTTTPWTLPGNVAVAVSPQATYTRARARGADPGSRRWCSRRTAWRRCWARMPRSWSASRAARWWAQGYAGPIFNTGDPTDLPIIAGDFVTTEDGTGLVHIAPAFGEDDYEAAKANGLFDPHEPGTLFNPVRPDGRYDACVRSHKGRSYEGRFVKDPQLTEELISDLAERDHCSLKRITSTPTLTAGAAARR